MARIFLSLLLMAIAVHVTCGMTAQKATSAVRNAVGNAGAKSVLQKTPLSKLQKAQNGRAPTIKAPVKGIPTAQKPKIGTGIPAMKKKGLNTVGKPVPKIPIKKSVNALPLGKNIKNNKHVERKCPNCSATVVALHVSLNQSKVTKQGKTEMCTFPKQSTVKIVAIIKANCYNGIGCAQHNVSINMTVSMNHTKNNADHKLPCNNNKVQVVDLNIDVIANNLKCMITAFLVVIYKQGPQHCKPLDNDHLIVKHITVTANSNSGKNGLVNAKTKQPVKIDNSKSKQKTTPKPKPESETDTTQSDTESETVQASTAESVGGSDVTSTESENGESATTEGSNNETSTSEEATGDESSTPNDATSQESETTSSDGNSTDITTSEGSGETSSEGSTAANEDGGPSL